MFCGDFCRNEAWKKYHKQECDTLESHLETNEYDLMIKKSLFEALTLFDGSVSKMINFIGKTDNETLFDYDLSKGSEKEKGQLMLKATCALMSAVNSEEDQAMINWMLRNDPAIKSLIFNKLDEIAIKKFLTKLMGISDRNSYLLYDLKCKKKSLDEEIGSGIFTFASLFNHSCNPNLYRFFFGNQQVYVAKRPIESGQQLFVGYM
jgi:SET domain